MEEMRMNQSFEAQNLPMKWHKFMIYFALWFGSVMGFVVGFLLLNDALLNWYYNPLYVAFPALRYLNIALAVCIIALAACQIYVRFQLAGFRIGAPEKLFTLYKVGIAVSVIDIVLTIAIIMINTNVPLSAILREFSWQILRDIVPSVIMFFCNKVYYNKRAHLFVN